MDDIYRNPGPLQFDGPGADAKPITLNVEDQDYMGRIKKLQEYLEKVFTINTQYFIQRFIHILA
jgi:pyrophosphate--fructose-6-phosphate 1-phosphotransferase